MQLVESIPLLVNSKANDYIGINLYVDDTGSIKNLPINVRASAICRTCGHAVEVRVPRSRDRPAARLCAAALTPHTRTGRSARGAPQYGAALYLNQYLSYYRPMPRHVYRLT